MTALSTIELRDEVRPEDLEAVRELVESTGVFSPVEIDCAVELVDERLVRGAASGYEFLFAQREGRVIGYACFGAIPLTVGSYDLYWIAVDKSLHGLGIGRFLLAAAEQRIAEQGGRQVYIETSGREIYAPTRAFYLRCRYTTAAVLADFYAPGDDKHIFVRTL